MSNPADAATPVQRVRAQRVAALLGITAVAALVAYWTSDTRLERQQETRTSFAGAQSRAGDPSASAVIITEFLAANVGGLRDEDGNSPDWIEVHNRSEHPVNLEGWTLTNETRRPDKWAFPEMVLEPGAYLVVFASGKDRRLPDRPLHTNFRLDAEGSYLGLFPPQGVSGSAHTYFPRYPNQTPNVSFGVTDSGLRYFAPPTPGAVATAAEHYTGAVMDVHFSAERGIYSRELDVRLSTPTPRAEIRYTLDGRVPTVDSGEVYRGAIRIDRTTPVLAAAFREGWVPSPTTAHTFVLPSSTDMQGPPESYPDHWGEGLAADYGMDPEITRNSSELHDALRAIPSISIAIDPGHLFNSETGIYINTENDGRDWERPASVEFIDPEGGGSFQMRVGLRIHGRSSRKPMTSPKHSFRLLFKARYGDGKLSYPLFGPDAAGFFETLVLHATSNYSWTFPLSDQRERAQYTRDAWAKETQRAMGHVAPHTRYAHLYLNGLYWGLYSLSERPDTDFMASYLGGDAGEYDVRRGGEAVDGEERAWRTLFAMASGGFGSDEAYAAAQELIDIDNFIDYLILNHYSGNENWDYGNWYAARRRAEGERFRFFVWDMENILGRTTENILFVRHRDRPTELFHRLRDNAAFRARFSERVRLHLTGDGVLTPKNAAARYEKHARTIETAIVAESARWGDYRKDVHPYRTGPYERYTRDQHWVKERDRLLNEYFPARTDILLDHYRRAGLYSD